jgi:hypothetical protein
VGLDVSLFECEVANDYVLIVEHTFFSNICRLQSCLNVKLLVFVSFILTGSLHKIHWCVTVFNIFKSFSFDMDTVLTC